MDQTNIAWLKLMATAVDIALSWASQERAARGLWNELAEFSSSVQERLARTRLLTAEEVCTERMAGQPVLHA